MENFSVSVVIRRCITLLFCTPYGEICGDFFLRDRPVENVENVDKSVDKKKRNRRK